MASQAVSIYNFNGNKIRVMDHFGVPWFIAADVCRVLGLTNPTVAISHLAETEKAKPSLGFGGHPGTNLVSESGLYKLVMRSEKPLARPFQDWVTRDVLLAIRKDGAYIMGEEKVATGEMDEDTLILKAMEALQRKVVRLREENATLTVANDVMAEELNFMTVDEFRSMSHVYLSQGERVQLGKRASAYARSTGAEVGRQHRTLRRDGRLLDVFLNVYPRAVLEAVWKVAA